MSSTRCRSTSFAPRCDARNGDAVDPLEEIRTLYFRATAETIQRDFERAIDLLKAMRSDEERGRAHVYMEGLAEMRKEWTNRRRSGNRRPKTKR